MGYKGQKIGWGKKDTFRPYLPIYIPSKCCLFILVTFHYDVVTALTHCKYVRISLLLSVYMCFGLICFVSVAPGNTRQVRVPPRFSQSASLWLHPSILFIRVDLQNAPDDSWIEAEAAAEDRMPSAMRYFVSYLLGAMTVFCLACRLSLCTAIFGSGFRTLCSLSYPVLCTYKCI